MTVVAAGAALLYFSGVGGNVIRWLQTRFGELVGFVTKVAGEIGQALMAGDMQRAATILWAAIKVAFARGVQEVSALWKSVQASAQQAWSGVRAAASQVMAWFGRAWTVVRSALAALGQTSLPKNAPRCCSLFAAWTMCRSSTKTLRNP